jgi:hypothetical protein
MVMTLFILMRAFFCAGRCFKIQRKKPWSALCMVIVIDLFFKLSIMEDEGGDGTNLERMSQLDVLDIGYWEDLAKRWLAATRVSPIADAWHNWHLGVIVPSHWELADYLLELLKQVEKFVVYSEGTLYSSISLLKIGRDIMPTPQGLEGYYAYFSRI